MPGIEFAAGTPEPAQKILDFFAKKEFPKEFKKDPLWRSRCRQRLAGAARGNWHCVQAPELPIQVGVGLKPVSYLGRRERLVHSAITYAIQKKRKSR